MILTKELLERYEACQDGIDFCERNKLFGFDLDRLDEIEGDYKEFIAWIYQQYKTKTSIITQEFDDLKYEYDASGNVIREEYPDGSWTTWNYDNAGNKIKIEVSDGKWTKCEYDSNNNLIKVEYHTGCFFIYDYDSNNKLIRQKNSDDSWYTYDYDVNGNIIKEESSTGLSIAIPVEYYPNGQLKQYGQLIIPLI